MKLNRKSFAMKLWLSFVLFATLIFGVLWLLQIVFLQNFYDKMVIKIVKKTASEIAAGQDSGDWESMIDTLAVQNSLLIYITDRQGNIIYSADEYSSAYNENRTWHMTEEKSNNPYRDTDQPLNWQLGAASSHRLPQDYSTFLELLADSHANQIDYSLEDNRVFIYGMKLPTVDLESVLPGNQELFLYISTTLGAVGATARILRIQLIWVTMASLVISFTIAFFLSRRFSRPISALSTQAKKMADGTFDSCRGKGFCTELDELADTLGQTSEALQKAEDYRRQLLANVSHDLRTPLTMIKGYAEMIRDISWEDSEKREADLDIIIRETDRLSILVNDILKYSAMKNDEAPMDFAEINISAAVQDMIKQFEPFCKQGDYRIEQLIAPDQYVNGDKKQLMRVLYNLTDNAIHHTGTSRTIRIEVKNLRTKVRVEIHDYGEGILPHELPFIWERYFTSKERSGIHHGSGLGLAIVKEILIAQKAYFGVESIPGKGSVFWFELKNARLNTDITFASLP